MTTTYFDSILTTLNYDFAHFTLDDFVAHISQHTGRNIFLLPVGAKRKFLGAWISDAEDENEYIFYRSSLPSAHQQHVILHELCHILLKHSTWNVTQIEAERIACGDEPMPAAALFRGQQDTQCEAEAEAFAKYIYTQAIIHQGKQVRSSSSWGNRFLKAMDG